jgi:hypothetical protein
MKAGSSKGNEWQYGFGATYNQSNSSYTLGFTHYGGYDAQTNWYASYHNGDFSFSMTNDAFLPSSWGGGDKYRTAAAEIGYGELSVGMNVYSNNPDKSNIDQTWRSRIYGKNRGGNGTYADGQRIYSSLYFGVNGAGTVSRIGVDSPWIQDAFQNGIHQSWWANLIPGWHGSPYFITDYNTPSKLYLYSGTYNPFGLF